jgi:hypothetical protein
MYEVCELYLTHTLPIFIINISTKRLRWSRGYVLASSTQVCGFKPGRSRRIFRDEKVPSTPSFGGEVKPAVPCRRFACEKIAECYVDVCI